MRVENVHFRRSADRFSPPSRPRDWRRKAGVARGQIEWTGIGLAELGECVGPKSEAPHRSLGQHASEAEARVNVILFPPSGVICGFSGHTGIELGG